MLVSRRWFRIAGALTFVAVAAASSDVEAGWRHRN